MAQIQHEVVHLDKQSCFKNRVNHFITNVVLKGGDDTIQQGLLIDVLESFFDTVLELYNDFIGSKALPGDKAQMVLSTTAMTHPISTPVRDAKDLTADHLLTAVSKAQNSGLTVKFSDSLLVEFIHIKCGEGWGAVPDTSDLMTGGAGHGVQHYLYCGDFLKKRSVIRVASTFAEPFCLAKSMVVAKANLDLQMTKRNFGERSTQAAVAKKYYEKLRKNIDSNTELIRQVHKLYEDAGVVMDGKPGDLSMLKKFEAARNICVKVVSMEKCLDIVYNKGVKAENIVYLCYSCAPGEKVGHYDVITNINGFFSKRFYC